MGKPAGWLEHISMGSKGGRLVGADITPAYIAAVSASHTGPCLRPVRGETTLAADERFLVAHAPGGRSYRQQSGIAQPKRGVLP